jgi:hypothetical protein
MLNQTDIDRTTSDKRWDATDVPPVSTEDLALVMRALIARERGLVLVNGLTEADLETVRAVLHRRFAGDTARVLAAFVRFRHLVEVFATRRLATLFLDRGHALIAPALALAARMRLNANRGFNPQHFVTALHTARTLTPHVRVQISKPPDASADRLAA